MVASASRECGCSPRRDEEASRGRCAACASQPAEATADGPSYSVAFETGRPVSSLIAVWYSNMTCSVPCETSGWYGVYGVRNSERESSASTSDGTKWSYMPAPRKVISSSAETLRDASSRRYP